MPSYRIHHARTRIRLAPPFAEPPANSSTGAGARASPGTPQQFRQKTDSTRRNSSSRGKTCPGSRRSPPDSGVVNVRPAEEGLDVMSRSEALNRIHAEGMAHGTRGNE